VAKRIFSTIVLWTVTFGSFWFFGAHAAVALLTLLAALALHEFYQLTIKMGARPFHGMGLVFSVLMTAGPYCSFYFAEEQGGGHQGIGAAVLAVGLLVAALIICCFRVLGERENTNRIETIAATMMGLLFVPLMLQFLVLILMFDGDSSDNLTLVIWTVVVSKFCDVGALLTGMAIGKHKMSPNISPKKTWEGAVGGVFTSAGIGAAIAFFAAGHLPERMTPLVAALIAVPLAITTIVSDLLESAVKRRADAKDSGVMIPGIGGAFDLMDSLILTAPVAYFIFLFLA
jgi:phosphatidate cytidylyltransferase